MKNIELLLAIENIAHVNSTFDHDDRLSMGQDEKDDRASMVQLIANNAIYRSKLDDQTTVIREQDD